MTSTIHKSKINRTFEPKVIRRYMLNFIDLFAGAGGLS